MKRFMRFALLAAAVVVLAAGTFLFIKLSHPSFAPYASLELSSSPPKAGRLTARFLGVTTILLDDGENALLTDGFFSRPGRWQTLIGKIEPDPARIDAALERAKIGKLAALLVAHSHHDHALDSAAVARRTDALLIGSESTANIGRGESFPPDRIRVIKGCETFTFGQFKVIVFKSMHSPNALFEGEISSPLCTPAKASAYKDGGSYSFLVEHGGSSILIHASANFTPEIYKDVRADIVFLGIATLGKQSNKFADDYWREVVQATGAKLVIPIHWDDFTLPLDQPLQPMPPLMDDFETGMKMVQCLAARDHVAVKFMPLFEPVDVLAAAGEVTANGLRCGGR
jgi:L-ascorbate metabolism protein UlaG (beta-lactamase superfamily)